MEKIYRVKLNSKGMPNFSTAVEIEDIPIYGNEHNCMMTIFGECSYAETGCGDCAVVEKVRKALSADRLQGKWIFRREFVEDTPFTGYRCSNCNYWQGMGAWNFCPHCGCRMKGADDE